MVKLDRDIIDVRISKVRTAAIRLCRFKNMSLEEFTGNSDNLDIAERNLEIAIEAMLDIGNHVIAVMGFEKPENYYDIFIILGKNNILQKDFAERIAPLAGLRNRIVHDYTTIDHELILKNIKEKLPDFEEFSKQILGIIS
ncbi:MAG: DUF86 domain-containing protein [Candidatus Margulisiibacteriota bacterium]